MYFGIFPYGYNLALETGDAAAAVRALDGVDAELSGFAYEGAAMALTLLDHITFRNTRLAQFLERASAHVYMVHVGVGCAIARLPWLRRNAERSISQLDPLMRWLAIDGYGFHQAFFYPKRFVQAGETDSRLSPAGRQVFDQGIGRSMWFSECGDVARLVETVRSFAPSRHADLWTGIGVACAKAGIVPLPVLQSLAAAAGRYRGQLALGSVNAVRSRLRAGNPAAHTDLACRVFCDMDAAEALDRADSALLSMAGSQNYLARQRQAIEALRTVSQKV